jgi:membrane fusion protein (multidrug efflux system)
MWVYFNVGESEYLAYTQKGKSKEKQKVLLQLANKEIFETTGYVETIEADFNNETGNIAFRAVFQNPKGILRHGETGNIVMPVQLKNAIIIPQKSTFDVLDKKYVYIVDEKGVITSKEITLGKVKNNEKIKYNFVSLEKELAGIKNIHAE